MNPGITPEPGAGNTTPGITPEPNNSIAIKQVNCVLVFDTNGKDIESAVEGDKKRWEGLLDNWEKRIASQLTAKGIAIPGDLINYTIIDGDRVTAENIYSEIKAKGETNAALFVWYTGHGAVIGDEKQHTLQLSSGNLPRSELMKTMKEERAPLTVLLTESCSGIEGDIRSLAATLQTTEGLDVLSDLFLRHAGTVDINSSSEGELAVAVPGSGGFLSMVYGELSQVAQAGKAPDTDGDSFVSWAEMADALKKGVQAKYEPVKNAEQPTQTPQVRELEVTRIAGYPQVFPVGLRAVETTRFVRVKE